MRSVRFISRSAGSRDTLVLMLVRYQILPMVLGGNDYIAVHVHRL